MYKLRKSIYSFVMAVLTVTCLFFAFAPARVNAAVELFNKKVGTNVTAVLTSDGTLDIYGTGAIDARPGNISSIWGEYYNDIKYVSIEEGVTSIGDMVFAGCTELRVISFPSSLTSIGDKVFWDCNNLSQVDFSDNIKTIGEYAFFSCEKLESVSLPKNLEEINISAFENCSIRAITIPEKVQSVKSFAFHNCPLKNFTVKGKDTTIEYGVGFIYNQTKESDDTIDDLTIRCPMDSKAEAYAETWGFDFISADNIPTPKISSVAIQYDGIRIEWPCVKEARGYHLLRKTGSGAYSRIQTYDGSGDFFYSVIDKNVSSGKTYSYAVVAYRGLTDSGYSGKSMLYLSTPKSSTANEVSGVRIKWSKVSGAKGYYIFRQNSSGSTSKIATITKATTTSYLDKKAVSGRTYTYSVRAYSGSVQSVYQNKVQMRLSAPSIKLTRTSKQMKVAWKKITGAKGYYVYRKVKGGSYKKIATIKKGTTVSYTDKTIKKGKTYTYYVRAYNGSYLSGYSTKTK